MTSFPAPLSGGSEHWGPEQEHLSDAPGAGFELPRFEARRPTWW